MAGGTPIGATLGEFTSGLSKVTKLLNPFTAALAAAVGAVTAFQKMAREAIENGQPAAKTAEKTNAQLGAQLAAAGVLDPDKITARLMDMAENGSVSIERLTSAFVKLVPIMRGSADSALEWVELMADAEAATGLSADQLTTAVMQITTQGKIEEEVAKKLPFWQKMAEARGEEI